MESTQFNQFNRPPFIRPVGWDQFGKICPCCNGRFHPLNRKKRFCSDYCKGVWHYEKYKQEHKNDLLLEEANHVNFLTLERLYGMGEVLVSARDLLLNGFISKITPHYTLYNSKMCAVFNTFGLFAEGELFRIIKLGTWKK